MESPDMERPDIIVVGVGRTGTSTIARLLHEEFGVHMANRWESPECNPLGSYEDKTMMTYSRHLTEKPDYTTDEWLVQYSFGFGGRGDQLVGLKSCQLALLTFQQWEYISPKLVIRTHRPTSLTIDSMMRWREPKKEDHWLDYYRQREFTMQKELDCEHTFPVLRIEFGIVRRTDRELKILLKPWIDRFGYGTI